MISEVGQFLLETWQLFYWSLFLPSKLQQRISHWSQGNEQKVLAKDNCLHSSFFQYGPRFVFQHLFLSAIVSLPLASLVVPSGDWFLCCAALSLSYSLIYFTPLLSAIGFFSPLLLALIYWQKSDFLLNLADLYSKIIQPFFYFSKSVVLTLIFSSNISAGFFTSIVILLATFFVTNFFLSLRTNNFPIVVLSFGSVLSVVVGGWIYGQDITLLAILGGIIILISSIASFAQKQWIEEMSQTGVLSGFIVGTLSIFLLLSIVMPSALLPLEKEVLISGHFIVFIAELFTLITFLFLCIIPGAIIGLFAFFLLCLVDILFLGTGLITLIITTTFVLFSCIGLSSMLSDIPLPWFLIACGLVAFSFAPLKNRRLGFAIAIFFVMLGWKKLNLSALLAIPVSLISYYHVLCYLWLCLISSVFFNPKAKRFLLKPDNLLTKLPPYTTELLWFPIPNHSKILEATFHQNNDLGIVTFKKMQAISLPGFQSTIDKTLPMVAPYLFMTVDTTANLIDSVTSKHPLFPLLLASFSKSHETKTLFSKLQEVANDTKIALQSSNSSLRERSLGRLVNRLKQILAELPEIILKPQSVRLWQLVIERWKYILEQEIAEQQRIYKREQEIAEQQRVRREQEIAEQQRIRQEREIAEQQRVRREQAIAEQQRIRREQETAEQQRVRQEQETAEQQRIQRERAIAEQQRVRREQETAEQQTTSQGELLNPFQFGNPLRPDRAAIFKGRQDFADRLVRLILDQNRPTLVLHGPRRSGKTSFLLNLRNRLPSYLVPIYVDMQQGSMTTSEGDFCYGLVRAIDRDIHSQGLQLPPIPSRQDFLRPYPTLEDWLDLALPQLGDRRLLLNLDEFEKIGSAIQKGRISERLFDQIRSMIQHYDRLGFLFSGVQTLEELGPRWSNYFISIVPMEMHYLERYEAEDLLLHPDPEFTLQYDDGIVDEILRLTRCQPYLLQLIGSALVNQANLQYTQLATTDLLQSSIQDAFTKGEPYFTNIWTEFTGTTPAEVNAGQQFLMALAQGNTPAATDEVAIAARRRLLRYHVIERIEGDIDKIEIPLFEQWVRERSIQT